ncbi:MAG: T9SS type A sorting domain-containing protein [Bacteroidales bacterium]|nr:T9SS type A sorting domain-containing protein [Bacteroidales bacterium]
MKKLVLFFLIAFSFSFANAQKVTKIAWYDETKQSIYNLNGLPVTVYTQHQQIPFPIYIEFTNSGETLNVGDSIFTYFIFNNDTFRLTFGVNKTINSGDTLSLPIITVTVPLAKIIEGNNTLCIGFDKTYKNGGYENITDPSLCATFTVTFSNSISEATSTEPNIYPNPAKDILTVDNVNNADIYIYNTIGQMVKKVTNVVGNKEINVSDLNNGMYIVRIQKGESVQTKKIQIIK